MKKEFIIYSGLIVLILALFSFENSVDPSDDHLEFASFRTRGINSLSIDIPANVYLTSGSESRVIVEGSPTLLNLIELTDYYGHLALRSGSTNNLFQHVMAYMWSQHPVNIYIVSPNIERIKVADNQGATIRNVLFNGDRAVVKVKKSGLIHMIKASRDRNKCERSIICASAPSNITAECL